MGKWERVGKESLWVWACLEAREFGRHGQTLLRLCHVAGQTRSTPQAKLADFGVAKVAWPEGFDGQTLNRAMVAVVYGCLSSVKVRAHNENVKCILLHILSPRHSAVTQHRSWNLKLPRQGLRLSLAPRTTCLRRSSVVEHMMRELTLGPLDVFSTR